MNYRILALCAIAGLLAVSAAAQPVGTLDAIVSGYQLATPMWATRLLPIARQTFASLALLGLLRSVIVALLRQMPLAEFVGRLAIRVLVLTLGWAILMLYPVFIPEVLSGFKEAGQAATGISNLNPSAILGLGVQVFADMLRSAASAGLWDFTASMWMPMLALLVFLCYIAIVTQLVITLCEATISIGAGSLFAGFAGDAITAGVAENFFAYVLNVGIRLLLLYLLVGIVTQQSALWILVLPSADITNFTPYLWVLGQIAVMAILIWTVPSRLANALTAGLRFGLVDALRAS